MTTTSPTTATPDRSRLTLDSPPSRAVRPAGLLLLAGVVVSLVAEVAHPHHEAPNDHQAVFAEYAASTDWLWVHLAQFGAAAVVVTGFIALYHALTAGREPFLLDRLAVVAAGGTLAAIMVNMAVDGVALKHAVDAWAAAPAGDRAARFDAVEIVRWLEWGANAFFQILLGLTVAAFGLALARRRGLRWHGGLAIPAGLLLVLGGALVGAHGFEGSPVPKIALLLFVVVAAGLAAHRAPHRRPGVH